MAAEDNAPLGVTPPGGEPDASEGGGARQRTLGLIVALLVVAGMLILAGVLIRGAHNPPVSRGVRVAQPVAPTAGPPPMSGRQPGR